LEVSAKVRVSWFLSGSVLEQETAVPEKANTTEVPAVRACGCFIFNIVRVVKTGVWHVDDPFSVARGSVTESRITLNGGW